MATLSRQISQSSDDVDNTNNAGTWSSNTISAFNVGNPGAVTRNLSLRFNNITIPQGAVINSAKIRFVSLSTKSPNVTTKIEGVDEDDTIIFDVSPDPQDTARERAKTSANASWNGTISQTIDTNLDTPDIATIVKEIVDRAGWTSGNDMAFFLSDNGSGSGEYISIYEYETDPTKASILIIDYDSGGSPSLSPSASPSPTPSESASVSRSASASPSPAPLTDFVIAVAKIGESAFSNDPNDFIFNSNYNTFKIITSFIKSVTLAASTNDQSFTQAHGLSFIPLVRGFAKTSGVSRVFPPNFYDISLWASNIGMDSSGVQFNYITTDATNITVNFNNTNGTTKDVSIRLFCLEDIAV